MEPYAIPLAVITFGAAIVNGALGYGFSSLTVPLALLFLANRVLNPALVPIEVVLNAYVLWVNRSALPHVWRRVLPIVLGLLPGVLLGTAIVSQVSPAWLKFGTYVVLLPLIVLQAAGFRRPLRSERGIGLLFGGGVGVLYSVTTISGPPLALALSNQGFVKKDFRASLGFIRLAESSFTAVAYGYAGLFSRESMALIPMILPSIVIGVPIGAYLIQHIRADTFRRVCMSFDAWIVAFGISTVLRDLKLATGPSAFAVLGLVMVVDIIMLYRFFTIDAPRRAAEEARAAEVRATEARAFTTGPNQFAVRAANTAID